MYPKNPAHQSFFNFEWFDNVISSSSHRDDIVFKDPLNTFIGIENYKSILWGLRFHGKIFFKALWVDIVSVWQPVDSTIMVRWTVHGVPRGPWETRGRFDGTSEYKLDKAGKIFEHRVHNIALNKPPKFRVLVVDELLLSLSCPSTPKPTCFEISSIIFQENNLDHCWGGVLLVKFVLCIPSVHNFGWCFCVNEICLSLYSLSIRCMKKGNIVLLFF